VDAVILDPELIPLLDAAPRFELTLTSLAAMRAQSAEALPAVALSDAVERSDHVVRADPELMVRVHRPKGHAGALPCVYAMHGGGYVLGNAAMDDARFDRWCPALGCVGVSVEYRLAPETPYPGPLEDCHAALVWLSEHADELGIDRSRVGVSGISAGGGLAAALALLARDRDEVPLAFQLLECPMIDDRRVTPSSRLDGLPVWSREANEFGWRCYLGALFGGDEVPPHAAPARAVDVSGLPPALVIVGGADGFRDEDIDYAARLGRAGVPTELHVLPGAPHGVQLFAGSGVARRWTSLVDDWLGRALSERW
jgi:acetyl esterase/lipase